MRKGRKKLGIDVKAEELPNYLFDPYNLEEEVLWENDREEGKEVD